MQKIFSLDVWWLHSVFTLDKIIIIIIIIIITIIIIVIFTIIIIVIIIIIIIIIIQIFFTLKVSSDLYVVQSDRLILFLNHVLYSLGLFSNVLYIYLNRYIS